MKHCLMSRIILCLALLAIPLGASPDSSANTAAPTVERQVDLQFNNVSLGDALVALFKGTNRSYTLDQNLQAFRVNAVLKNVSFETAVSQVLRAAGATYYVDGQGAYHISAYPQQQAMQQAANAPPPPANPPAVVAAQPANSAMKSQVINTKYLTPSQVANVIRNTPGVTQVEANSGTQVIVQGTEQGVDAAVRTAGVLDTDSALPKAVRLKMATKVTVGTSKGPKTYEASTESVGAEQTPSLLNLEAQTAYYTNSNIVVGKQIVRQPQQNLSRLSLVNATITPSFVADGRIALVGRGHFSCPFGTAPGTELSKDFDIAASVLPGKPFTVAAGSVNMVFGSVDFWVAITATPEQGRIPFPQNSFQPGYNYNNAAPAPTNRYNMGPSNNSGARN